MNKYLITVSVLVILSIGGFVLVKMLSTPEVEVTTSEIPEQQLSPVIENILSQKTQLITQLAESEGLVSRLRVVGTENEKLTLEEIGTLDSDWKAVSGKNEFAQSFLNNEIAGILREFQENNKGFSEVFLTDARGLNVGQTNLTSDYYQADEDWWTGAYDNGKGKSYHGEIEYDESSRTRAISLYVPVYDVDGVKVLGIIKAVIDLDIIQEEL